VARPTHAEQKLKAPATAAAFLLTFLRSFARAYRHERQTSLLDGHEHAFRWFGGVTLSCLYDNPRDLVLERCEHKVLDERRLRVPSAVK
jgi:transposase